MEEHIKIIAEKIFNGDILFVDPAYIMKNKVLNIEFPHSKNFFSYLDIRDYPDFQKDLYKSDMYDKELQKYGKAIDEYINKYKSDWEKAKDGKDLGVLGLENYMICQTSYSNKICSMFCSFDEREIGTFFIEYLIGIFLLDEVLKYNPDFKCHIEHPEKIFLINSFNGKIRLEESEHKYYIICDGINTKTDETILFKTEPFLNPITIYS